MGDSPKWVKSRRRRKKEKKERGAKVGDNNGQATHGARKHAWRTQAAWAKKAGFEVPHSNWGWVGVSIIMPLCGHILQVRTFKISVGLKFQDRAECTKILVESFYETIQ